MTSESQDTTKNVSETNRLGREISVTENSDIDITSPSQSPKNQWEGEIRNCEFCHEEFLPNQKSQRYCSQLCAQRSSVERKKLRIIESGKTKACPVCQKSFFPFSTEDQVYCSIPCFRKRGKLRK